MVWLRTLVETGLSPRHPANAAFAQPLSQALVLAPTPSLNLVWSASTSTLARDLPGGIGGSRPPVVGSRSGANSYCGSTGLKRRANYIPTLGDNLKTLDENLMALTFSQDGPQQRGQG
ncbi:hypothetical protein H5410_005616 [Solanum commersonii]|uniref:Uncharacterized protein n=1 Tax=Solanum commersonii TaxID=4109 RepID=A0A9J6A6W4_SOLCO|nr:hypothetical protein H5410_005616 [Solanum commersonii]